MKKRYCILLFAFLLFISSSASAADAVPLRFTYPPIDFPNIFPLPNGYYEAVYYTPNSTEYCLNQGRDDVSNYVIEVFDSLGQSVWSFLSIWPDIFADDPDAFYYQNVIMSDRINFESYWDHYMERHQLKSWDFDGKRLHTLFDSIKQQQEEDVRYITSQYPYTLETWPFGEAYDTPSKLTYVIDGTSVELPFVYGSYASFVSADERYYMLYEANGTIDGDEGAVYLLTYAPDTHALTHAKTNLTSDSGRIAVSNDTLVFLQRANEQTYALYTAALNDVEQDTISFTATGEISVTRDELIEDVIPVGHHLLCLKSREFNRNTAAAHWESELCALSPKGEPAVIEKWDGYADFLKHADGSLQFICEDGDGGWQIMKLPDEDIASFFPRFDSAP